MNLAPSRDYYLSFSRGDTAMQSQAAEIGQERTSTNLITREHLDAARLDTFWMHLRKWASARSLKRPSEFMPMNESLNPCSACQADKQEWN
jgi:hypothetical protein